MISPEKIFGRLGNKLFQYAYIYSQVREGNIPDIFVQDYKLFEKYESEIRNLFNPNPQVFQPFVSIHLRRGDYVDNSFYTDLTKTEYYQKAVEMFPGKKFLVFSDDIQFAKEYFRDSKFSFSDVEDPIYEMGSMASCQHNIIANSSFSYWGALLNQNPNKVVVAPREDKYYKDGVVRTKYPPYFTQIDI